MQEYRTDEQMQNDYAPKLRAFMDERLTAGNAKQIYNFLKPYRYDTGALALQESFDNTPHENQLFLNAMKIIIDGLIEKEPHLLPQFCSRLSYIENILLKGLPAREDLNEKIDQELKRVSAAATEAELTDLHSEAEIKTLLRGALFDTSMTKEMVQALMVADDVLGGAYEFYVEADRVGQVHLAVWEYLEKAEHEYISERVYDRVKIEYEDYIDEVKKMPPEKIIGEVYKITVLNDILISLDPYTSNFSAERLAALQSLENPLWNLYEEWGRRDVSYMDDIHDVILGVADDRAAADGGKTFNYDIDYDYEDGQEL